ncbi:galactokinase [Umboniibacter marinipuniceus]|uniref:Galactokinase n=1 Tax=Umboniibacter marinipuniceus TaxID=569599 RepID=A0A3M0A1Z0_9GAMM|nr:galactokinase [Umboniibacter marinipuniceus]RMA78830.1 galactokinase [Umboniibacter marinipuniceus]
MSQIDQLKAAFAATFNTEALATYQAPGRVNLIGEHTDYNDGFVLPTAINYQTVVACTLNGTNRIEVLACDFDNETHVIDLNVPITRQSSPEWVNYVRGVIVEFQRLGVQLSGLSMAITGNVPQGAGLSSSAALEVAVGTALNDLFNAQLSPTDIALLSQRAENDFVGCNCGIMDQLISATGVADGAQLIDCRDLSTQTVDIPTDLQILVINSNVKRGLVDSAYNQRREQCEAVAKHFNVKALRDISSAELNARVDELDGELFQRARHVVTENERTLIAAEALNNGDIAMVSRLMQASHASMRDDFNITVAPIDWLVDNIHEQLGLKGGVRMTGGGFGGCVVALVPQGLVAAVIQLVEQHYEAATGLVADIYLCNSSQGAGRID